MGLKGRRKELKERRKEPKVQTVQRMKPFDMKHKMESEEDFSFPV